jgi:hypothetical protein
MDIPESPKLHRANDSSLMLVFFINALPRISKMEFLNGIPDNSNLVRFLQL